MGVKGLWTLLESVGRRVPAEALGGKRLAVDASIWLVQFLKAMRDERGEALPNAHLLGFFRRVCKLLFLGVRPIFVFDGSTPELKRQTTAARRRGMRNAAAQARRAAEKLLLVQMRRHALAAAAAATAGGGAETQAEIDPSETGLEVPTLSAPAAAAPAATAGDALLAQQLAAELSDEREAQGSSGDESASEEDLDFDYQALDPEVLASLPPSVQLEFMEKYREHVTAENRERFQEADVPQDFSKMQMDSYIKRCEVRRKVDKIKDDMNASAGFQGVGRSLPGEAGREFVLAETGPKRPSNLAAGQKGPSGMHGASEVGVVDGVSPAPPLVQLPAGLSQLPLSAVAQVELDAGSGAAEAKEDTVPEAKPEPDAKPEAQNAAELHEPSPASPIARAKLTLPGLHMSLDLEKSDAESLDAMFAESESDEAGTSGERMQVFYVAEDGEEADEAFDWEEVGPSSVQEQATDTPASEHWRERAAKRQKYWSSQYGFRLGRSLSKWSEEDGHGLAQKEVLSRDDLKESSQKTAEEGGRKAPSSPSAPATVHVVSHPPHPAKASGGPSGKERLPEAIASEQVLGPDLVSPGHSPPAEQSKENLVAGRSAAGRLAGAANRPTPPAVDELVCSPSGQPTAWEEVMEFGADAVALEKEATSLRNLYRKQVRNADSPTEQMYVECQDLLQMFGIPYIIAPMEAEAQCAYLNCEGLVDGVLTDDSDVFLFGGKRTYRNFFNNNKFVEAYHSPDIDRELGLDRHKLIQMALLLGSDYTSGVHGVGVVNAFEIIQAFGCEGDSSEGLKKFKKWVEAPGGLESDSGAAPAEQLQFKNKHRGVRRNWELPENFPDERVVKEYSKPKVDAVNGPLEWGTPDINMLHKFCQEKFGWDIAKAEEHLRPVLQATGRRDSQRRMDDFLAFNDRFVKIKSKRIQRAIAANVGTINPDLLPERPGEVQGPAGPEALQSTDREPRPGARNKKRKVTSESVALVE